MVAIFEMGADIHRELIFKGGAAIDFSKPQKSMGDMVRFLCDLEDQLKVFIQNSMHTEGVN